MISANTHVKINQLHAPDSLPVAGTIPPRIAEQHARDQLVGMIKRTYKPLDEKNRNIE
jgi:hypothetical protein